MKSCLLFALLTCSLPAFTQHIKFSEVDPATNTRRIITSPRWVNKNLGNGFAVAFRSEDTAVFVQLSLFPSISGIIAADNDLIFQLEDNSIIVAHSKGMQVNSNSLKTAFEYRIAMQDVKALDHKAIKAITYSTASGQHKNIVVEQANKNDLQGLCNVFMNEYQNAYIINSHVAMLTLTR